MSHLCKVYTDKIHSTLLTTYLLKPYKRAAVCLFMHSCKCVLQCGPFRGIRAHTVKAVQSPDSPARSCRDAIRVTWHL